MKTKQLLSLLGFLSTGSISWGIESMPSLVNEYGGGEISVSPYFKECVSDLHLLLKRSYLCSDRDEEGYWPESTYLHYESIFEDMEIVAGSVDYFPDASEKEGHYPARYPFENTWFCKKTFIGEQGRTEISDISDFFGIKTEEADFPGFIALRRSEDGPDIIAVVLRGSQGEPFQAGEGLLGPSWMTNYSCGKKKLPKKLFGFKGKMHYGFLSKVLSYREFLTQSIYDLVINEGLDPENLLFIVTGHSQGGALAQITLVDLCKNLGPALYGEDFDNRKHNRFYGYFLSAARVAGNKSTVKGINRIVGKHNMIRHSTVHDPVPNAGIDRFCELFLLLEPFSYFLEYHSLGMLALDDSGEVLDKAIISENCFPNAYNPERLTLSGRENLELAEPVKEKLYKSYDCHLKAKSCSKLSPKHRYWKLKAGAKLLSSMRRAIPLGGMGFLITSWHFGSCANDRGEKLFDVTLPEKNIEISLARGKMHKEKRLKRN